MCEYFQQLEQLPQIDTMTGLQRNSFVMKRISKNLRPESDARVGKKGAEGLKNEQ
jgi:hypothetical protein